jgi:hypothetical protein
MDPTTRALIDAALRCRPKSNAWAATHDEMQATVNAFRAAHPTWPNEQPPEPADSPWKDSMSRVLYELGQRVELLESNYADKSSVKWIAEKLRALESKPAPTCTLAELRAAAAEWARDHYLIGESVSSVRLFRAIRADQAQRAKEAGR